MEFNTILLLLYLGGIVSVALAGDRRTIGMGPAALMALFATPLVAAVLLLAWPSRQDAEMYYKGKMEEAKAKTGN